MVSFSLTPFVQAPLPAPLTALVGREAEVQETLAMLTRPEVRLLTLLGPGGVGKTRLALEVAQRLQRGLAEVVWLEVAALREPDLVLDLLARTLDLPPGGSPEAALVRHLREWRGVLVLDNLEQVLEVALPLARLLEGCPHLRLLVTSREPLRLQGEWRRRLSPLALPPAGEDSAEAAAVELFWSCVRRERPGHVPSAGEAADAAELCRALGGLPLALELAASRASRLGVPAVLAQVRGGKLPVSGARDLPERHRSLEAVVRWSYDLLTPGEQRTLRRLSVFAGTWDVDSAAPVWPGTGAAEDRLDLALSLTDKHLVTALPTADGVMFRLPEIIRTFALARLEESGEAGEVWGHLTRNTLASLLEWRQELNGPGAANALERFAALEDNLREVLRRFLARGEVKVALDLAAAAGELWLRAGHPTEGRYWLEQVRLRAEVAGLAGAPLVAVLHSAGKLAFSQGHYPAAEANWRRALALVSPQEEPARRAQLLGNLGVVSRRLGRPDEARTAYEEALGSFEALGEDLMRAHTFTNLGALHDGEERLDEALAMFRRARDLYRALGNEQFVARADTSIGNQLTQLGQVEEGLRLLRGSHAALEALDDRLSATLALFHLGEAHHRLGQMTEARTYLERALAVYEALESYEDVADSLESLAALDADTGRPAAAAWALGHARAIRGEFEVPLAAYKEPGLRALWERAARPLGGEAEVWRARGAAVPFGKGRAAYHAETFPQAASAAGTPPTAPTSREVVGVSLSPREQQVLSCIARGRSNKELCRELDMSASTARTHVTSILNKLEVNTRAHAVARATQLGLLRDP